MNPDDVALVARAKHGDRDAVSLLFGRFYDRIYDFIAHRLNDTEVVQDATQTVFLRALASLPQCRNDQLFAGWLFAIARNVVIDSYRTQRYVKVALEYVQDVPDGGDPLDAQMIERERQLAIREARTRCLTPHEMDVLDLRLQNLPHKEIALALDRTPNAIKATHSRIVHKLRHCLSDDEPLNHASGESE